MSKTKVKWALFHFFVWFKLFKASRDSHDAWCQVTWWWWCTAAVVEKKQCCVVWLFVFSPPPRWLRWQLSYVQASHLTSSFFSCMSRAAAPVRLHRSNQSSPSCHSWCSAWPGGWIAFWGNARSQRLSSHKSPSWDLMAGAQHSSFYLHALFHFQRLPAWNSDTQKDQRCFYGCGSKTLSDTRSDCMYSGGNPSTQWKTTALFMKALSH